MQPTDTISFTVDMPPGFEKVELLNHRDSIATIASSEPTVSVPVESLGYDRSRLQLRAESEGDVIYSVPLMIELQMPESIADYRRND